MDKKKLYKIITLIISILIIYKVLDFYGTQRVDKILKSKNINYTNLSVNFLLGNIKFKSFTYIKDSLVLNTDNLELKEFSYYSYFKNQQVVLKDVIVNKAKITGNLNKNSKIDTSKLYESNTAFSKLKIENVDVNNLQVSIVKKDGFPLSIANSKIEIEDLILNTSVKSKIPFSYNDINFDVHNFETKYSVIQNFSFLNLNFENGKAVIDSLKISPLKPKTTYIYHLKKEKELLDLAIKQIVLNDFDYKKNNKLQFYSSSVILDEIDLNIYLDKKVLKETTRRKKMYSEQLRNLPFLIDVDQIKVNDSKITYQEHTIVGNNPGRLIFDDLNANIKNLDNNPKKETKITTVDIKTKFMKEAPLEISWTFDINDTNDTFRLYGSLFDINSKNMSSFLKPTMNVKMDGYIDSMYFDINGNDISSNGNFNIDFKNFKINVLDGDKQKKKIISWIVNLFLKNSSKNGMAETQIETVKRNQAKSFWNFFWINIEAGLKESFI